MSILSELRSRVRTEIGEAAAGYWTDAQLDNYVNVAAARFSADTGLLLEAPRKADVTAGSNVYTLPEDCPGPHAVVAVFYGGRELEGTSPIGLIRAGASPHTATGTPTHWYTVSNAGDMCLALHPSPASDLADGLVIWFWKLASEMSEDESVSDIPDDYIPGVVYGAAELAFIAKREYKQAEACRKLYQEEVTRARSATASLLAATLSHNNMDSEKERSIF